MVISQAKHFPFWNANNLDADAHRGDGKRFIVRADEKLTTFVELKAAVQLKPFVNGQRTNNRPSPF